MCRDWWLCANVLLVMGLHVIIVNRNLLSYLKACKCYLPEHELAENNYVYDCQFMVQVLKATKREGKTKERKSWSLSIFLVGEKKKKITYTSTLYLYCYDCKLKMSLWDFPIFWSTLLWFSSFIGTADLNTIEIQRLPITCVTWTEIVSLFVNTCLKLVLKVIMWIKQDFKCL